MRCRADLRNPREPETRNAGASLPSVTALAFLRPRQPGAAGMMAAARGGRAGGVGDEVGTDKPPGEEPQKTRRQNLMSGGN